MAETQKPKRSSIEQYLDQIKEGMQEAREAVLKAVFDTVSETEIDLSDAYETSMRQLSGYVTLDLPHWHAVRRIRMAIAAYANDRTRRRPLNFLMHADPGSGKSFLVKSIARGLTSWNASAVDFNMATLANVEDLIQPLDSVRNLKIQDRLPILFLDEFDSDATRYPLLLPLMWDGQVNIGHRNLDLGKLVIILAGSGRHIGTEMAAAKTMQNGSTSDGKIVDLLSRINGGELEIPPLDLVAIGRDRRADKVCLTISLLQARFGQGLELVPLSLLRFVAASSFRYGVRSLAHLIDLIEPVTNKASGTAQKHAKQISHAQLAFPLSSVAVLRESSLAYHMFSTDGPATIIDAWRNASSVATMVRIKDKDDFDDDIPF
jgi:predicted AAA+ superfamily ATPase